MTSFIKDYKYPKWYSATSYAFGPLMPQPKLDPAPPLPDPVVMVYHCDSRDCESRVERIGSGLPDGWTEQIHALGTNHYCSEACVPEWIKEARRRQEAEMAKQYLLVQASEDGERITWLNAGEIGDLATLMDYYSVKRFLDYVPAEETAAWAAGEALLLEVTVLKVKPVKTVTTWEIDRS